MIAPLTSQTPFIAVTGQLDQYLSGRYGSLHNAGDVQKINGFSIDTSGETASLVSTSSFAAPGVPTYQPGAQPALLSGDTLGSLLQSQEIPAFDPAALQATRQQDTSQYIAGVPATVEVHYTPAGAEPQSVEGLGFIPGDVFLSGNIAEYQKQQVARAGELARTEKDLRQQYGSDVKLAYDPLGGDYVMLRPGQAGYDRVKSAGEVFAGIPGDLQKIGGNTDFSDVLAQYGDLLRG